MSSISKQLSSITFTGKREACSSTEIRLALLGKTGSGKSSTGNSILGRKIFDTKVSSCSVTQRCRRVCGEFRGRHITILDTPGLLDTNQTPQEVHRELRRSVSLLYPGPHVFLLIFQIGRFTQEERDAMRQIKQAMGTHALSFSVVVFTHGDCLDEGTSVQHCLIDGCQDLAELVNACEGRYCVFNNRSSKTKEQVSELLALVDGIISANGGSCYTSKMLQKAEDDMTQQLQEEERLLCAKEEMLKRKQEAEIREWYERELEVIEQKREREMEELKIKMQQQKVQEEKLLRVKEEAFRREREENDKKERERKIHEMVRVMQIRREEEEKREALQEKFDRVTKTLEEQTSREETMRRAMEERIQKDQMENDKKEREREFQQVQREQAIRQREEMKRDALQKELDKLSQSLEEHSQREEQRRKQMEDLLRHERQENQREMERQMENQRAERRRVEALQQELRVVTKKIEQQKTSEEKLRRHLDESLRRERERCDVRNQRDKNRPDPSKRRATENQSNITVTGFIRPVGGYAHEMGLVALNTALESVGSSCCVQ